MQVFVSYDLEDQALYTSLALALDGSSVSRWERSKLSPGNPLADELRAAIEECELCIFLATTRSIKSSWCLAELGAFWGAGKRVIVYMADPEIEESDLPPQFRGDLWTANAVDLVKGIKEAETGRVRKISDGYSLGLGPMTIKVFLGRIEDLDYSDEDSLVALPANEFFDDDCIQDTRSALGAFMQHHFRENIPAIQALVRKALANEPGQEVVKRPQEIATSYGIGKCVFLYHPLSTRLRIAMVSVTTQRADLGLRADAAYVFEAVSGLQRVMANQRLTRLYVPLLGGGHGGLKGEVSLMCMLIAFGEIRRKLAHNLKEISIVVFGGNENSPPTISEGTIKRALDFTGRFFGE
jgi:TIR domain-containing protein/antiphage defense system Thoeris ThsA-like protein